MIAVMVIIATVGSIAAALIGQSALAYQRSISQERGANSAALALDRIVAEVRDMPEDPGGGPAIRRADAGSIQLDDGTVIEVVGTSVMLTKPGDQPAPLCQNVSAFELSYMDAAGAPLRPGDPGTPGATRRVVVRIVSNGVEARALVVPRAGLDWRAGG